MDLDFDQEINLWQQGRQEIYISSRQLAYIIYLYEHSSLKEPILKWLPTILTNDQGKPLQISALDKLPKHLANKVISEIKRYIPLPQPEQLQLQQLQLSLDMMRSLLKRDCLKDYSELSVHDYDIINNILQKFTLRSHDVPLKITDEYEYGYQYSKLCQDEKMNYLKFFNLLMVDYDNISLDIIKSYLDKYPQDYFAIYQTYNGYHVFLLSKEVNYASQESRQLLLSLRGDIYYILFVRNNGYKIRLSPKITREEPYVAQFVQFYGLADNVDNKCQQLLKIHDKFLQKDS